MSVWAARRFWTHVTVEQAVGGYAVALDGRRVTTPGKLPLVVPSQPMAENIAAEWDAQEKRIAPATMPWTRSANTAIEKIAPKQDRVAAEIVDYAENDLLSYRASGPDALALRQTEGWDPMLDWLAKRVGVRLRTTTGVMPIVQDPRDIEKLKDHMAGFDAFELTGLGELVALSGSFVLGLAAVETPQDAERLWRLSRIDHDWQAEQWGEDADEAAVTSLRRAEFMHAARFVAAHRQADFA